MTNLLNPCSTTIEASPLPPNLKALSLSVNFTGWRFANTDIKSWATEMAEMHKPIWIKAGILEAVMASTNTIHKDIDLVLGVAEKWCPNTNTFVFPWGEATITLEDVIVLLGFSVLGSPVFAALDSEGEKIKAKLVKEWSELVAYYGNEVRFLTHVAWMKRFGGCGDELEHVAFLVLWLCYFVFPSHRYLIYRDVFSIAVHLSRGTRIALAPAVLAHLYADLSILKTHITAFAISKDIKRTDLKALFKLVQVWAWERFKELQPVPNKLMKGETRLALWHDVKHIASTSRVRRVLDSSKLQSFEWRPYTKTVENWEFPKFHPERAMLVPVDPNLDDEFVGSQLVGIKCVEHYFPDRVASQFGMLQDVPGPAKRNKLSQEAAWSDYSKPIEDLTLRPRNVTCVVPSSTDGGGDSFGPLVDRSRLEVDSNDSDSRQKLDSIQAPQIEQRADETGSKSWKNMVLMSPLEENNSSDPPLGFDEANDIAVSLPATIQNCEDELDLLGSNAEKMTFIGDGSKEPECLLHEDDAVYDDKVIDDGSKESECLLPEDGVIAGEVLSSSEKDVNADSLIQQRLASKAHNNEPTPHQKLANGDERSMVLRPSDESNIHIALRGETQGQDCLLHDNALGQEETRKISEHLEDVEKGNEDVAVGNAEKMTIVDGAVVVEKASSGEKENNDVDNEILIVVENVSAGEKEDDDSLIQQKLASMANNSEPSPCQKLGNGDKNMESNIHIPVGGETQGHDCSHHDNTLGTEETRKPNVDVGNYDSYRRSLLKLKDSFQESSHELKKLDSTIDELIIKADRNLAWLKEQRAKR